MKPADAFHGRLEKAFAAAVVEHRADLVGISALLTTTMGTMGKVVELIRARGLAGRVKLIVGGAPVSAEFATAIGADAYGYDAANAVERVKALLV